MVENPNHRGGNDTDTNERVRTNFSPRRTYINLEQMAKTAQLSINYETKRLQIPQLKEKNS